MARKKRGKEKEKIQFSLLFSIIKSKKRNQSFYNSYPFFSSQKWRKDLRIAVGFVLLKNAMTDNSNFSIVHFNGMVGNGHFFVVHS